MSDQMPLATRIKLSAMMFLQFMMFAVFWGALATFVTNNKWDAMKPWILSTMPLGALASPLIGMVADRFFAAQKVLAVLTVNRLLSPGSEWKLHREWFLGSVMGELLGGAQSSPQGLLRVNATLGFGRSHIAPLISRFARRFSRLSSGLSLHGISVSPPVKATH